MEKKKVEKRGEEDLAVFNIARDYTKKVKEAVDTILKENRALREENERLNTALVEMKELRRKDALTGLGNEAAYIEDVEGRILLHMREAMTGKARPLSLIVVDGDNLKGINDRFGHKAGDEAIKQIAESIGKALNETLRRSDSAYRRGRGADEFTVVLEDADSKASEAYIKRLRSICTVGFSAGSASLSEDIAIGNYIGIGNYIMGSSVIKADSLAQIAGVLFELAEKRMYIEKRMKYGTSAR